MRDKHHRVPGMRIVGGADSPDVAKDVLDANEADEEAGGFTILFWKGFFKLVNLAVYVVVALAIVAVFWGLYLLARGLAHWMGL